MRDDNIYIPDIYSKLPKSIEDVTGIQQLDSDVGFIRDLTASAVPKTDGCFDEDFMKVNTKERGQEKDKYISLLKSILTCKTIHF